MTPYSAARRCSFTDPVAGTDTPAVYQSVRYGVDGYQLKVPAGVYTVTLQFNEPFYAGAGKRVFGVQLQGRTVIDSLDIFARVGKDYVLDETFPGVRVTNGLLKVSFMRRTEFPAIAGIVVTDGAFTRKIKCGFGTPDGYEAEPLKATGTDRTLPVADLYADYALANFGPQVGPHAGRIMAALDGLNMPKPLSWALTGPGRCHYQQDALGAGPAPVRLRGAAGRPASRSPRRGKSGPLRLLAEHLPLYGGAGAGGLPPGSVGLHDGRDPRQPGSIPEAGPGATGPGPARRAGARLGAGAVAR